MIVIDSGHSPRTSQFLLKVFGVIGFIFFIFTLITLYRTIKAQFWHSTPCQIIESYIETSDENPGDKEFIPHVKFKYMFEGRKYTSDSLSLDCNTEYSYNLAAHRIYPYKKGKKSICYVNPDAPKHAVLSKEYPWVVYICISTALLTFSLFCFGFAYFISANSNKPKSYDEYFDAPPTLRKDVLLKIGFLIVSIIFILAGTFACYVLVIKPLYLKHQSQNWQRTPCKITHSDIIASSSHNEPTTYDIDMLFEYTYNKKVYQSFTYGFKTDNLGHPALIAIQKQYPMGKIAYCYVNQNNPNQAVISREYSNLIVLIGLIPIVFIIVGLVGFIVMTYSIITGKNVFGKQVLLR